MDLDGGNKRVFNRLGGPHGAGPADGNKQNKVCYHWRAGKCHRFPCPFLHRELPPPGVGVANGSGASKRFNEDQGFSGPRRGPPFNGSKTWGKVGGNNLIRKTDKVCNYWMQGSCSFGDKCKFLHDWRTGEGFKMLTQLDGHQKVVCGIAMSAASNILYTGSKDETVRAWDCSTGQCTGVLNAGGEVGCMIIEGLWLFIGMPNFVKAINIQSNADQLLSGPVGQVYDLVVGNELLFAGTQDGSILAWKFNVATNCFEPAVSLKGHTLAVVCLFVGANRLYSGSMDRTIKIYLSRSSMAPPRAARSAAVSRTSVSIPCPRCSQNIRRQLLTQCPLLSLASPPPPPPPPVTRRC